NGSSIPFLRATPAETHPGCRKVNKKFRERDIPTAPLPAGGISPPDSHNLNLSAIPAYTARAPRFRGWRPFALLYPTILPRCRFEISSLQFSKQRRAIDIENSCSIADRSLLLDRLPDNPLFYLLHPAFYVLNRFRPVSKFLGDSVNVIRTYPFPSEDIQFLHEIFELPDIARPGELLQNRHIAQLFGYTILFN